LNFRQRALFQQGYQSYSVAELRQLDWGLRFTPVLCMAMAIAGVVLWIPWVPFVVASLGVWSFFFPSGHPFDIFYNRVVRHLFGGAALPPSPLQRRLACLSAAGMNIVIGLLMLADLATPAYAVLIALVVLQVIVITSHLCVLSVIYEAVLRMFGKWQTPLSLDQVERLAGEGARLVDVRSPQEFANGHLKGAVNIPVDDVVERASELGETSLLYCASGFRSHIAAEKLKQLGVTQAYNAGAQSRIETLFTPEHVSHELVAQES